MRPDESMQNERKRYTKYAGYWNQCDGPHEMKMTYCKIHVDVFEIEKDSKEHPAQ